jgi:hypothetical protein
MFYIKLVLFIFPRACFTAYGRELSCNSTRYHGSQVPECCDAAQIKTMSTIEYDLWQSKVCHCH